MSSRIRIRDLLLTVPTGTACTVAGWVRSVRGSGDLAFIVLNDGSNLAGIQLVLERANLAAFDVLSKLNTGAALTATDRKSVV